MSKPISSYGSQWKKLEVVARRLAQPESNRGLGYWSAYDARQHVANKIAKKVEEQTNE